MEDFKGRTFNLIGRFGHVRALAEIEQNLAGASGIVVDETTGTVCETFGPDERFKDWQGAVRAQGVSLFTLFVNDAPRAYASDVYGCVNSALSLLMTETRPAAFVIVDDKGATVATIARVGKDGASVVWGDTGRVERWRSLTWVFIAGKPAALVGLHNGRIEQV